MDYQILYHFALQWVLHQVQPFSDLQQHRKDTSHLPGSINTFFLLVGHRHADYAQPRLQNLLTQLSQLEATDVLQKYQQIADESLTKVLRTNILLVVALVDYRLQQVQLN